MKKVETITLTGAPILEADENEEENMSPEGGEPENALGIGQQSMIDSPQTQTYVSADPEEMKRRRGLILSLNRWIANFPDMLKDVVKPQLFDGMSTEELESQLEECKFAVSCQNSTSMIASGFQMGTGLIEGVACSFTPIKLQGYSQLMSKNPEVQNILKEIALIYEDWTYLSPEKRLMIAMARGAFTLHMINSHMAALQIAQTNPVQETPSNQQTPEAEKGKEKEK